MPTVYMAALVLASIEPSKRLQDRAKVDNEPRQFMANILAGYQLITNAYKKYAQQPIGLYYKNGRIVIPDVPSIKQEMMKDCHDNLLAETKH